jgi:hypothetical protein
MPFAPIGGDAEFGLLVVGADGHKVYLVAPVADHACGVEREVHLHLASPRAHRSEAHGGGASVAEHQVLVVHLQAPLRHAEERRVQPDKEVTLRHVQCRRGLTQPHAQHLHQPRGETHRLDEPVALLYLRRRAPVVDLARIRPHAPPAAPLVADHCADFAGESSVDTFNLSCHIFCMFYWLMKKIRCVYIYKIRPF